MKLALPMVLAGNPTLLQKQEVAGCGCTSVSLSECNFTLFQAISPSKLTFLIPHLLPSKIITTQHPGDCSSAHQVMVHQKRDSWPQFIRFHFYSRGFPCFSVGLLASSDSPSGQDSSYLCKANSSRSPWSPCSSSRRSLTSNPRSSTNSLSAHSF